MLNEVKNVNNYPPIKNNWNYSLLRMSFSSISTLLPFLTFRNEHVVVFGTYQGVTVAVNIGVA